MGYARKDLEKTKKIAKKFVRYQEGAESCGKVTSNTAPREVAESSVRSPSANVTL